MGETLEGTIASILFFNPENGYAVLKFGLDEGESLTVVGNFPPLSAGERLRVTGRFELNPKFGRQFKVEGYIPVLPAGRKGVERFLSCGLVKGIGPVLARRILDAFGEKTLDILARSPDKLREVEGIGPAKLRDIKRSWADHVEIRDLIIFLQEHGISTNLAHKIHRQYGAKSYAVLKTNPYQLCLDIWGVGFKTADQIALKLGMDPRSEARVKAFILYLCEKDNERGHVFSLRSEIAAACLDEIEAPAAAFDRALDRLKAAGLVVTEDLGGETAVYLPFFHQAEDEVVRAVRVLSQTPVFIPPFDVGQAMAEVEQEMGVVFSDPQREAIRESVQKKIVVITGGPGTGKTTIIRAVVALFDRWGKRVHLAAPTGRAAKRLSETTGREAKTIHRTLEFNPKLGRFRRDPGRPLEGEALIVDEFSMVDLALMHGLVRAIPPSLRLILVGDKDQLPALGPGTLLRDLIASGRVKVVRLDEVFRQEQDSLIVRNAHRINQGLGIEHPRKGDSEADFYFIRQDDDQKAFSTIMQLVGYRIPRRFGLSPLSTQVQVISPMYKGAVGVERLNAEMQARLNKSAEALRVGIREFRVRDKVMQVRNDYEKEVFNGDIGAVVRVDPERYGLVVNYDGRPVFYEKDDLDDITLAYAISVHKSQGSEYQAVVLPLLTQHFIMLQRNLLYTALTRAKKLSVIVGSYKALYIAVKNDTPVKRNSRIREKLLAAADEAASGGGGPGPEFDLEKTLA
ncbi:MAG: ATP-dependent RecD-like DNA helicase [Candidatus Aminicenantes bacterium]|nr:ATP-dependent RecD-like DNA helicase [Candidatus Aminicenantes bacterium]